MGTQQDIFELITKIVGQNNVLTIPRLFIDFVGTHNSALFLSQLLYWTDKTKSEDGFVYKTYSEWYDELCLSKYEVMKCSNTLQKMGFLTTKVKKAGGNPTVHYKLDKTLFTEQFIIFLKLKNQLSIVKKLNYPKLRNSTIFYEHKLLTESTLITPEAEKDPIISMVEDKPDNKQKTGKKASFTPETDKLNPTPEAVQKKITLENPAIQPNLPLSPNLAVIKNKIQNNLNPNPKKDKKLKPLTDYYKAQEPLEEMFLTLLEQQDSDILLQLSSQTFSNNLLNELEDFIKMLFHKISFPPNWKNKLTALLKIVQLPKSKLQNAISIAVANDKINSLSYVASIFNPKESKTAKK